MLGLSTAVGALKAAAEPTRLRILVLLSRGELNVKDLTRILGQSQPRISRHLKLLAEAGLVERAPEGSWVYFRLAEHGRGGEICPPDPWRLDRGRPRADARPQAARRTCRASGRKRRSPTSRRTPASGTASARCTSPRPRWKPPSALRWASGPFDTLVDLGTGTGRMLELFADRYRRGIGLDLSAGDARLRARQAGARRHRARAGAPGRHLRSAARRRELRMPSSCTRCCTSSAIRSAPSARRCACWRPVGGC